MSSFTVLLYSCDTGSKLVLWLHSLPDHYDTHKTTLQIHFTGWHSKNVPKTWETHETNKTHLSMTIIFKIILTSSSFFLNCQFSWAELYHLKKIIKNYQYCLWIHSRNLSFWILNFIWNQTISQYWNYFKLWFSQSQTLEST